MTTGLTYALLNVLLLWILTTPHEFAHAWVADKLGDDTPRLQGRLTLNPLAHVDWLGTALLPFLTSWLGGGFLGWGKPVMTDNSRLRGGFNGLALVAWAGPASNVVMAVILAIIARLLYAPAPTVARFFATGVDLSLYLALFNLLPVPPLDGSKLLLAARVPIKIYMEISRFGFMLLVLAISVYGVGQWMNHASNTAAQAIFDALP
jgi:Zn-dependent protease